MANNPKMSLPAVRSEDYLEPGERVLWEGRPRQGIVFRAADIFLVPFSVLWCGFAVFWMVMASIGVSKAASQPGGAVVLFFPLFGLPFVLVGLYFVFGRFLVDKKLRENTRYFLTSHRVLIITGWFRRRIKTLDLRTLSNVTLDEKANGVGTITFGEQPFWASWYGGMQWPGVPLALSFEAIADARQVYNALRQAQRATYVA